MINKKTQDNFVIAVVFIIMLLMIWTIIASIPNPNEMKYKKQSIVKKIYGKTSIIALLDNSNVIDFRDPDLLDGSRYDMVWIYYDGKEKKLLISDTPMISIHDQFRFIQCFISQPVNSGASIGVYKSADRNSYSSVFVNVTPTTAIRKVQTGRSGGVRTIEYRSYTTTYQNKEKRLTLSNDQAIDAAFAGKVSEHVITFDAPNLGFYSGITSKSYKVMVPKLFTPTIKVLSNVPVSTKPEYIYRTTKSEEVGKNWINAIFSVYDISNKLPGGVVGIIYMIKMDSGIENHYYFTTTKPIGVENPSGFYYFVSPPKYTSVVKCGIITKIHNGISYDSLVYMNSRSFFDTEPVFTFYLPV